MTVTDQKVEVTEVSTVPTKDPNKVHIKKDNGSLPLDCPVTMQVTRHMDDTKGLIGHTVSLQDRTTGTSVTLKIVREKLMVVLVDDEEVVRKKKKVPDD